MFQVEERFRLATATYQVSIDPPSLPHTCTRTHTRARRRRHLQVSVFTDGVLAMRTTLVGSIPVNPKELLEDGNTSF